MQTHTAFRLVVFLGAVSKLATAQSIALQSSPVGVPAANVTSIAGATPIPFFNLYVNAIVGSFDPSMPATVNWNNANGGFSAALGGIVNQSGTQVIAQVPNDLFPFIVATPQTVQVSVTQVVTSGTAVFTIVPQMTGVNPILPADTIGLAYSAPILTGGTPPYNVTTLSGSPPPGLGFQPGAADVLQGTAIPPPGPYRFGVTVNDFWDNTLSQTLNIQSGGIPVLGPVTSSAGAAYAYGSLTNLQVAVQPFPPSPPFSANIVTFFDGTTALGTVSVNANSGTATLNGVFLSTGIHNAITAVFLGDANWQSATSAPATITVNPSSPSIVITGSPFSATYGGVLSAGTVQVGGAASPAVAPTGTITVSVGSNPIATLPIAAGGPVILTGTALTAAATANLTNLAIAYSGDPNYLPAPTSATISIARAVPVLALTLASSPLTAGLPESMTATVRSSSLGVPTGTVTFLDGGASLGGGSGIGLAAGAAQFSAPNLAAGPHSLWFTYSGDTNFLGGTSAVAPLSVLNTLTITTTSLSSGVAGQSYVSNVTANGGVPPYTYAISGAAPGLGINSQTGLIAGTPLQAGTFNPTITVTDSARNTATVQLAQSIGPPPLQISASSNLPNGVVGTPYAGTVGASGGTGSYVFSVTGTLPPGLTFLNGLVSGIPTTPGQFSFTVQVADANNATAARDYTVTIQPAPLTFTTGPTSTTATSGTPININFGCTGGVAPYRFSVSGSLPPGVTFANCILSGTPTVPGTYLIHITVTDANGNSVTKDVTITVAPPTLALTGSALAGGQVGVAYSASVSGTGGTPPLTYSGSGLPDGLSFSPGGAIAGTPTTAGTFSVSVTVTDATKASVTATFTITILPAALAITTTVLPDGMVGAAYTAAIAVTGGVKPYTISISGLPDGLKAAADGSISGTPTSAGAFTVSAVATDSSAGTVPGRATQNYTIKIAPAALVISTASAPNGTVGTAYSASFAATGGTAPITFSATGLPQGLTISAGGTISGTPTAPGTSPVTVTAKDATGATAAKTIAITIVLPAAPAFSFGGIQATVTALQQPRITVSLAGPFPVDVIVTLTVSFVPDSGPVDPAIAFSSGGTTATITIPAGSLNGATDVGLQTGSEAGTFTITAKLTAAGVDVTPSPAPSQTIRLAPAAAVITSLTATRTSTGFTVTAVGYVTDREITQANFTFTAAAGANLQTTSLTAPVDTIFTGWFGGATPPSAAFGGQFSYVQQLTVNGSNTAIASVTLTLTNRVGVSNSATANLN